MPDVFIIVIPSQVCKYVKVFSILVVCYPCVIYFYSENELSDFLFMNVFITPFFFLDLWNLKSETFLVSADYSQSCPVVVQLRIELFGECVRCIEQLIFVR